MTRVREREPIQRRHQKAPFSGAFEEEEEEEEETRGAG